MGLSAKEMDDIGELVNMAFLSAFSNSPSTHHAKLLSFAFGLIRKEVPYHLFSGQLEGTKRLTSLMYDDPDIRDFVLKITMHVFSKMGDVKNRYPALVENLTEAIGYIDIPEAKDRKETATQPIALMPEELLGRLPLASDVSDVLLWNRWATTMVLMMLYLMTPEDLGTLLEEKKRRDAIEAAEQARMLARQQRAQAGQERKSAEGTASA
jgi:hypothetical protein